MPELSANDGLRKVVATPTIVRRPPTKVPSPNAANWLWRRCFQVRKTDLARGEVLVCDGGNPRRRITTPPKAPRTQLREHPGEVEIIHNLPQRPRRWVRPHSATGRHTLKQSR